jgi:hypothetical protein
MAPSKIKYSPIRTEVLEYIEAISDPDYRTFACVRLNVIGEDARTRAILSSCIAQASPFCRALAEERLKHTVLPVKKRVVRQRKPWRAPNRLPSLFAEPKPAAVAIESMAPPIVSMTAKEAIGLWAQESLNASLSESTLGDDVDAEWLVTLVEGISDEQRADLIKIWENAPRLVLPPPVKPNLFDDFDIEIGQDVCDLSADAGSIVRRRRRRAVTRPTPVNLLKEEV